MDVNSLLRLRRLADEEHQFTLDKRITDLFLFLWVCSPSDSRVAASFLAGTSQARHPSRFLGSAEDYEKEEKLRHLSAAHHRDARIAGLGGVMLRLHDGFSLTQKPLNYISGNYTNFMKGQIFPISTASM